MVEQRRVARNRSAVMHRFGGEIALVSSMMQEDRYRKYRAYSRFIRRLLLLGGIWPGSKNQGILYRQVAILAMISGCLVVCALGNFCWQNITNLSRLTKSLGLMGSFTAIVLKVFLFRVYQDELRDVNGTLDRLFESALREPRLQPALLSLLRYFYRPVYVYTALTAAIMLIYLVGPTTLIVKYHVKGIVPKQYLLPFPASYPWPIEGSMFLYELHYFFEMEFSYFVVCITCGVDTLFGFYAFQISALLRVQAFDMENLRENTDPRKVLQNCVQTRIQLLRCRDIVQEIYGPIILLMAVTNALIMCTLIFQAFESDGMTVDKAILSGVYVFMKMSQSFMYAWYGHIVTRESETLQREMYCSSWYEDGDNSLARGILLSIMQRPIDLTACHFFKISLDFFTRILNTTISYFFLLQTLDDRD